MDIDEKTKVLVKETVRETLLSMGFNISDPDEMISHQKDQAYLRSARLSKEALVTNTRHHAATVIVSGLIAAIVMGAVSIIKG